MPRCRSLDFPQLFASGQRPGIFSPPQPLADQTLPSIKFMRALLQNLVAGFRLATFLKVSADDFHVSIRQLVALTLVGFAVTVSISYRSLEDTGYFNSNLILQSLAAVTLTLAIAALLAHWTRTPALLLGFTVAATAMVPTQIVYTYGARALWQYFDAVPEAAWTVAWLLYFAAILTRAAHLWVPLKFGKRLAIETFLVAILAAQFWWLPQHEAWYPTASHDDSVLEVGKHEAALYQQARLLDRHLDALQAQRSGVADLYFVGFAGYGWQDVFMKEVNTVRALFNSRFDTRGRSLTLINHAQSAATTPLATTTALQATLARVGSLLDPDEDLLFLFVTSHGSGDPAYISVDHDSLQLTQLTPTRLKAALDATPIKWKVIVVSACYSGSFIPPLRDDNTLIITASSADRNSFGCDDRNNLTDFGRAYFAEALTQTTSFTAAFELARKQIAAREAVAGLTPSQPQMSLGKNFAAKWRGRYH